MKHQDGNFTGLNDDQIYYQSWKPDDKLRAVLIIVHGFGEHSGRYMNVVNSLVPEGIAIYALDHRGHGKSEGKENYVNRFSDFLEDLSTFESIVVENHPELPLFILGHSMGSLIATHYIAEHPNQNKYSSLILSGTGAGFGPEINKMTIFMAKILSFLLPGMSIPSNLDPNFISRDQEAVEAYINDPLVHYDKITARLGSEMLKRTGSMEDAAKLISIPTLIQVGSEDESFSKEDVLYKSISHDNKQLNVYDGYLHEVYNELDKEPVLDDLKSWIASFL